MFRFWLWKGQLWVCLPAMYEGGPSLPSVHSLQVSGLSKEHEILWRGGGRQTSVSVCPGQSGEMNDHWRSSRSYFIQYFQYAPLAEPVFQERSLSEEEENQIPSVPFSYVSSSQEGPAPIIYSIAQSKVAVYKPNIPTTTTTTSTTTRATSFASTTLATTIRPFHYKLPPTEEPQNKMNVIKKKYERPLVFNKRPTSGSGSVSRPFEYLSRLSQFLSDRVFTGRTKVRKNHTKNPRPALITRRQSDSGQRWSGCSWCETGRDYVVRRGRCYTTPCHHIAETTEPPHILRQTLSALFFHADFTFKWMDINSKLDSTIQNI